MLFTKKNYLLLLIIFYGLTAFGQLSADFSANKTTGCGVLGGVVFTDLSSGNPTSWLWDFGNGNTSTLQNPTANFSNPGSYTVRLTISAGSNSNSITKTSFISVFNNPESKFAASPTSGCVPLTVNFTDNSTSPNSTITSWLWDFNDGSPASIAQNPTHTYTNVATYNVSLKVTDNNGCTNTKIENSLIRPNPQPRALINTSNARTSCTAPYTVNFVSNSLGLNLSYLWNFGDGNTSTQANPSHTYNALGVYDVSLRVIDQSGCRDSSFRVGYITLRPVQANFDFLNDSICIGDTAQITNTSINGFTFNWTISDGRTANTTSPNFIFNNAGFYRVRLVASRGGSCTDEITKTIYVDSVKAQFDIQPLFACEDSTIVKLINQSYHGYYVDWRIGNSQYINKDTIAFFSGNGNYVDSLIVRSLVGCVDTVVRTDRSVAITKITLSNSTIGGCIPHTSRIKSTTTSTSPIISFFWEFGDNGALGTSTARDSVSYNHLVDTNFNVYVTIIDSNGCEAHDTISIGAGIPPKYTFQQLQDTVCASDSLQAVIIYEKNEMLVFSTIDSILGGVLSWGFVNDTLTIKNFQDTGITYIQIKHIYNGCESDTTIEVYVKGPIIYYIQDSSNCSDQLTHYYSTTALDFNRFYWDFGDNSPIDSVNIKPIHTFATDGTYGVKLTLFNDSTGCIFELIDSTIIDRSTPVIGGSRFDMCIPYNYSLQPNLPADVDSYYWIIGNDTIRSDTITGIMDSVGSLDVQLIALNKYGCVSIAGVTIIGYEFKASFIADTTRFCDPSQVIFRNTTTSNTFITSTIWDFGNGDTSTFRFDTTNYNLEGYYDVTLTATDANGCVSSTTKDDFIRFFRNIPRFSSSNRTACVGEPVPFSNNSIGDSLTFFWDLGNGQTSTARNTTTTYLTPGKYTITLKSQNPIGCEEEWTLPDYINVEESPVADFISDTAISSCYPLPVSFTNTSTLLPTITFNRWDFGDNTPIARFQDAFHNYTSVGNYDVTLIVGTNAGCKDTITKLAYIQTNGPEAGINFYPDSICINETITYEIVNATGVASYIWDFGDGKSATTSPVTHRYTDKAGLTYPTLILSDSTGECVVGIKDTVYIKEMIALIGVTDTNGCEPFKVDFIDNSLNTSRSIWKLYDNTTSSLPAFTRTFSAGFYPVQLITEGLGCFDTTDVNLRVFPKPRLQLSSDTSICEGDSVQLFGSGAPFYNWLPIDGLSNPADPDPLASPSKTTNYKLTITDTNECKTADSLLLTVYNKPLITLEEDSLIYLGEEITIVKENNRANVIYSWTPPTGLSCTNCPNPIAKPLKNTWYYLQTTDLKGCFEINDSIFIEVFDGFTAEMPNAFTPNGDGNNDIIYLRGWGIKELLVYQIYNRWGELVFETTDLKTGWDGNYKGQPQAVDTYIFVIKALGYNDQLIEKKGNISLIR